LEYETLSGDEIKAVLRGEPVVREEAAAHLASRTTVPVFDDGESAEKNDF